MIDLPKKSERINRIGLSRLPVCLILSPSLEMKLLNLVSLETHRGKYWLLVSEVHFGK